MAATGVGRGRAVGLCLLTCALLVLLAARHVAALEAVVPIAFGGLEAPDVLVLALLVGLLAGASALLARAHRQGLSPRTQQALALADALLVVAALAIGGPKQLYEGSGGLGSAYSSQLFLDFSPVLPWLAGTVVVAGLGLLPVAAVAAVAPSARRVTVTRWGRAAALATAALASVLLLVALEREVALVDLVRGEAQALAATDALVWVAALWALTALVWSAGALRRAGVLAPRLALVLPPAALLGAVLLLLGQGGRQDCCFAYAPPQLVGADAVVGPDTVDLYGPPPLPPDLLLLAGCLVVGVGLPLGLQALRVRTSASTPPG